LRLLETARTLTTLQYFAWAGAGCHTRRLFVLRLQRAAHELPREQVLPQGAIPRLLQINVFGAALALHPTWRHCCVYGCGLSALLGLCGFGLSTADKIPTTCRWLIFTARFDRRIAIWRLWMLLLLNSTLSYEFLDELRIALLLRLWAEQSTLLRLLFRRIHLVEHLLQQLFLVFTARRLLGWQWWCYGLRLLAYTAYTCGTCRRLIQSLLRCLWLLLWCTLLLSDEWLILLISWFAPLSLLLRILVLVIKCLLYHQLLTEWLTINIHTRFLLLLEIAFRFDFCLLTVILFRWWKWQQLLLWVRHW